MALISGTRLGPFEIVAPLGAGGMGEVYRAKDTRLGREVALKVLPSELLSDRERLIRFAQEARAASALNHPNIVTLYEIGQVDALPFMAMELIEGRTLREIMAAGPLANRRALDLATQMAEGLSKAHDASIVHRDLKPENVMVTRDGFVKILDFGLAKLVGPLSAADGSPGAADPAMTRTGFVLGTAGYMSPEQASGCPLDFRSDQFSCGLIFYEMLTGRRAFQRATAVQTLSAIIQDEVEPLERINPRVPAPLRWVIERCLAKDPEERYASTRDLARELKQIRDNLANLSETGEPRPSETGEITSTPAKGVASALSQVAATRLTRTTVPTRATAIGSAAASEAPVPSVTLASSPPSRGRRVADLVALFLVALLLLAGGGLGGFWLRGVDVDAPLPNWNGELLLGATTRVMAPRISPDGQTLAFLTIEGGQSQVAVLKPASGDWTVLTHQNGAGSVYKVDWSRDGTKLFYDRVSDVPQGIFSVPAIGGTERLLLDGAQSPEALADGSLLVLKIDKNRDLQIHRLWPDTGKLSPIGPAIVSESSVSMRAFPDGREAIVWAKLAAGDKGIRLAYRLDLESGRMTRFAPEIWLSPPMCIGSDGRSVIAMLVAGDLSRIVSVARDGKQARTLMSLTSRPWAVTAGSDGSLYVDLMENPAEILRFPSQGGAAERIAGTVGNLLMSPIQFPDGRIIVPTLVSGRRRLLVTSTAGDLHPLVDLTEQAAPPAAIVGRDLLAFVSGSVGTPPIIALATLADGRIIKRLEGSRGAAPQSLLASPDGKRLYYPDGGFLWSIEIDGGAPRKLRAGNGVALDMSDPRGPSLIVQINERDGVQLVRSLLSGGPDEPISYASPLRITPAPLSTNAVGPDGRIVATVASKDSWFRAPALLQPVQGTLDKVPVVFEGDILFSGWGQDGSLLGMGVTLRSALWRFQPESHGAKTK